MGMTRKQMIALNKDSAGRFESPPEATDGFRTRRDLLAWAFGCTAAVAAAGIHAPAKVWPDDVFDGGTP